ncbi:MAG: RnfABCDGE type electron transport complex subunit D [Thermoplasmata archaeon]|nr:RnfABCDGE type electron transport complex subunit D [Thermoplasmata archaeon]
MALGIYGLWFLGGGLGLGSLILLPIVSVLVDLGFQRARFEEVRFPDGAIVTGLFLALILPPVVPLVGAATVTIGAIAFKHCLRYRGRPIFNPAVTGIIFGAVLFGMAPAWWGSIDELLLLTVGVLVLVVQWRGGLLAGTFLVAYAFFSVFQHWLVAIETGSFLVPQVLLLSAIDPAVLFFALLIVTEPRTAPANRRLQPVYASIVAAGAALMPLLLPTIGILVALLVGNLFSVAMRRRAPVPGGFLSRARQSIGRRETGASTAPSWSVPKRAGAGIVILLIVLWVAAASYSPSTTPSSLIATGTTGGGSGGSSGGATASICQKDNQSIPSATLSSLHKALGPSVILSYSAKTGVTVFYDPVNAVTVTETDLYEDFGFAEFNGDDATAAGCVP